jgi:deoxyribodipyrimidine photo-lyase
MSAAVEINPEGPLQAVWFKRDLRVEDHTALARAVAAGPVLCVYAVELEHWQQPCTSNRQWQFVRDCLLSLDEQLTALGTEIEIHVAPVVEMLDALHRRLGSFTLHSHQETGGLWTYARDRAVAAWCRSHSVLWHEYPQDGVVRPVSRRGRRFKEHWDAWVMAPLARLPTEPSWLKPARDQTVSLLPTDVKFDPLPCEDRQTGGLRPARALLDSFLDGRGQGYGAHMSAPLTAEQGCSRLSPHIAHGSLSLRQIAQTALNAREAAPRAYWHRQLGSYVTRLWWHCYALQVLENQPNMERQALVPEMEHLLRPMDRARFDAWRFGRTGWPMVDACMRFLHHQGWLNFRMRAMLVTIATHTLSLPWRPVADWLAQLFVDFEPGIHYTQIQMHSSMAASPVLRLYNPVTQARELDPHGQFVRRWVPELQGVPDDWITMPWAMPATARERCGLVGTADYPAPLVDFEQVHRSVKAEITALRSSLCLQPAPGFNERQRRTARTPRTAQGPQQAAAKVSAQLTLF